MTDYVTKDSGERVEYETGMRRDADTNKPRFDLMVPDGIPWDDQMLVRFAKLMQRGMEKYGERNWEKARTTEELARFKASAFRHFMQWYLGQTDEDHAVATWFNIMAAEYVEAKNGDE